MINITLFQLLFLVLIVFILFGDWDKLKEKKIRFLETFKKWKNNQEK